MTQKNPHPFKLGALSLAIATAGLAGCGSTPEERGITGAGLGALGGAAFNAPAVGAALGGATGAFTENDDLNLGDPVWEWD